MIEHRHSCDAYDAGGACTCQPSVKPAVTKTGKVLTDEDFEALADEAEAGYVQQPDGSWIATKPAVLRSDLLDLLREAHQAILGLVDQQAMDDDWWEPVANKIKKVLDEANDNR